MNYGKLFGIVLFWIFVERYVIIILFNNKMSMFEFFYDEMGSFENFKVPSVKIHYVDS